MTGYTDIIYVCDTVDGCQILHQLRDVVKENHGFQHVSTIQRWCRISPSNGWNKHGKMTQKRKKTCFLLEKLHENTDFFLEKHVLKPFSG